MMPHETGQPTLFDQNETWWRRTVQSDLSGRGDDLGFACRHDLFILIYHRAVHIDDPVAVSLCSHQETDSNDISQSYRSFELKGLTQVYGAWAG